MSQPPATESRYQTENPDTYTPIVDEEDESSKPWRCGDEMRNPLPKYEGDPWAEMYEEFAGPDRERCKAWREEVENLLIFAGLFSAVVTPFIIESYKLLKEDSGDTSAALLLRIALQLEGNGSVATPVVAFSPSSTSVRINIFWFLSLILSLATVIIGTLCLQWIREHQRLPSNARDAIALLSMQTESLERWYVPQILNTLPLLLQMGFILFLVGIFDFLWDLHRAVAIVAMGAIGSTLAFYVMTTILPTLQHFTLLFPRLSNSRHPRSPCPYRSPQAWVLLNVSMFILSLLRAPMVFLQVLWHNLRFFIRLRILHIRLRRQGAPFPDTSAFDGLIGFDFGFQQVGSNYRRWLLRNLPRNWDEYRKKWLKQRDDDVVRAGHLHLYTHRQSARLVFYDHIMQIRSAILRSSSTGRSAPWACLEGFIEDVARSKIPDAYRALYYFTLCVTSREKVVLDKDSDPKWTMSDEEMFDSIICCLGPSYYRPPHKAHELYWYEKSIRVLGAYVERAFTSPPSDNSSHYFYISQKIVKRNEIMDIPEHSLSPFLNLAQRLLITIGNVDASTTSTHLRDVRNSTFLFFTLGKAVAAHFDSGSAVRSHKNMISTISHIIKTASGHSKALSVTVVSYYLFGMLKKMSQDANPLLSRAVTEAQGALSLVKQYREHSLKENPATDTEHIQLLLLQSCAVGIDELGYDYPDYTAAKYFAIWSGYLAGMLDSPTEDTPASPYFVGWRKVLGSFKHNIQPMEYWADLPSDSISNNTPPVSTDKAVESDVIHASETSNSFADPIPSGSGIPRDDEEDAHPVQELDLEAAELGPVPAIVEEGTPQMAEDSQALESVVIAAGK